MGKQVAGVFSSEQSVLEAVGLFHDTGYGAARLLVLSGKRIPSRKMHAWAAQPRLGKRATLLEAIFWGALIGGAIVEVAGVLAALLFVENVPVRWFIIVWVWKFGAFIGGFVGTFVFEGRGPEWKPGDDYKEHVASGAYVLAVTAEEEDMSSVRGILIESGGMDVLDVQSALLIAEDTGGTGASGAQSVERRREP